MKKILLIIVLILITASCKEEKRNYKPFEFQKGYLNVQIIHPKRGTGPGFLVNAYKTKEDITNNKPYASATTDMNGVAFFDGNLHVGLFYIDCLVIGDTLYYKMDSAWVTSDTNQYITLLLEQK